MKPINNAIRQKKIKSFSILMFITGGVVFLLLSSLWQGDYKVTSVTGKIVDAEDVQSDKLVKYDELLHARLTSLQQLDEQYASLLTNSGNYKSLDSLDIIIHQEEEYFTAATNRIYQNIGAFTDESKRKQFVKMIASFRSAIAYRSAINSLRNEIAFSNHGSGTGELQKLINELDEKKNKISMLENSVTILKKVKAPVGKMVGSNNSALKENIAQLENRVTALISANNNLKQTSDRLLKQQSQTGKKSRNNERVLGEKANSLRERIEMLNAEIQLTRVDYNLLKMDAAITNSSSGQRKQLLFESSSILTGLSANDNATIRKKAKDKALMLNHISTDKN
jgi:hypothetical protein